MIAAVSIGDVANVVAAIAAVAAVVASLVTVRRAGETVSEAKLARQESRQAHTEEVAELQAVREATVTELRAVATGSASAHREQMREHSRAFAGDLWLQRVTQVQTVANIVHMLVDTARSEHLTQPPPLEPPVPGRATRIPTLVMRLRVALRALEVVGGPPLPKTAELLNSRSDMPLTVLGPATTALYEIDQVLGGDPRLQRPTPEDEDAGPRGDDRGTVASRIA